MMRIFLIAIGIVIADQVTKYLAVLHLQTPMELLPFLRLTYHENTGIAFSIPIEGLPLVVLTILLICGGSWIAYKYLPWQKLPYQYAIGLILGGALGNCIDRVRLGYVVDFISVGWFPVFNVADSAISIGGVLLFLLLTFAHPTPQNSVQD